MHDPLSRRILQPSSWPNPPRYQQDNDHPWLTHWGSNLVEFENCRYTPRRELTARLNTYDVIQIISGTPALAYSTRQAAPPKVLQVATNIRAERTVRLPGMPPLKRFIKRSSLSSQVRLEKKALQSVNHILVENRSMRDFVTSQCSTPTTLAPPGIDTSFFKPTMTWTAERPVIAFGRLNETRKDWPTALRAFEAFARLSDTQNVLIFAGKGPAPRELLRDIASSPFSERVQVREDIPFDQLPALLSECSVFLQSSFEEGLGLAGLEAMACGLPVVATRTDGSREYVVSGHNGVLVDLSDNTALDLADALATAMNDGAAMSIAARQTCTGHFSTDVAITRFLNIYRQLVPVI